MNKGSTVQSLVGYLNGYLDLIKEKHDATTDRNEKNKWLFISKDLQFIKEKCISDYIELDNLRQEYKWLLQELKERDYND